MTFNKVFELETKRLVLQQWTVADRQPFANMCADPRVMAFYPRPLTRTESDAMAEKIQDLIDERGWGFWALRRRDRLDFIGFTGLHIPTDDLPFAPCVEIGWRLAYAHWGKGYATEAAIAALGFGFEQLGLDEVVSFASLANARSRAVMERLGMQDVHQDFQHPQIPEESSLKRHCLYKMTRDQWKCKYVT